MGGNSYPVSVFLAQNQGVAFYLLDYPPLYDRDGLYGEDNVDYPDNALRFAVLSLGALSVARHIFRPDVLQLHDWQAALVPVYQKRVFSLDPTVMGIKTLLTIHNLGYLGRCALHDLVNIGLDDHGTIPTPLEFWGDGSFLKGGIAYADALNTVSPRYAMEIQTAQFGFGLDGLLRSRRSVLSGIVNGVDYAEWSPEADKHLPATYSADDLSGKLECKRRLLTEFGLSTTADDLATPVVGIVSRFATQKGFDLVAAEASHIVAEDLRLVVLGTGEPAYERMFQDLAWNNPQKVAVRISYDNRVAHLIEAGADMFLMPSRYEPCGLNQIYSLRYGTVPLVRATGGLDDTIEAGTGFKFWDYSGSSMLQMIRYALAAYQNKDEWTEMMRLGMSKNYSWDSSAVQYSTLYRELAGAPLAEATLAGKS
jgi:starch synthase